MDPRVARRLGAAAVLLGIAANALFDGAALGVNVPLAVASLLVAIAVFERGPIDRADLWLPLAALGASLPVGLRTDPTVVLLDLVLISFAVAAWAVAAGGVSVTRRAFAEVMALGGVAVIAGAAGAAGVLGQANADGVLERKGRSLGWAVPVLRGLVVAGPVVVIFAALLASADAVFSRGLQLATEVSIDPLDPVRRAVWVAVVAWPAAGLLALAAGSRLPAWAENPHPGTADAGPEDATVAPRGERRSEPPASTRPVRSWRTEALTVLAAVDLLFAVFVGLQVAYLFGGRDTLALTGLTYSEYARQGYFQLVAVVALAGILVIAVQAVASPGRGILVASLTLLGLTGVILASAAYRLRLYQEAYGWTELRFYVAASIAWLTIAVVLAAVLLVRRRMRWLPHGLAIAGVAITLGISALGPQAFVMRQNLDRLVDPSLVPPGGFSGFDVDYASVLGDDTIPDVVATLDHLAAADRARLLVTLRLRRDELSADPTVEHWAAWNLARQRAIEALAALPAR